jgi:hypothetical protein
MNKMVTSVTGIIKSEARHSEYLWDLGIENGFPAGRLQPRRLDLAEAHELASRVQYACDYEGIPVRINFDESTGFLRWTSYDKVAVLASV